MSYSRKNLRQSTWPPWTLSRLSEAGLQLQKSKCKFMVPEVQYLGHKIDAAGLHPLPEKVKAIHAAPTPTDVIQLKSYLGLISYYALA